MFAYLEIARGAETLATLECLFQFYIRADLVNHLQEVQLAPAKSLEILGGFSNGRVVCVMEIG